MQSFKQLKRCATEKNRCAALHQLNLRQDRKSVLRQLLRRLFMFLYGTAGRIGFKNSVHRSQRVYNGRPAAAEIDGWLRFPMPAR